MHATHSYVGMEARRPLDHETAAANGSQASAGGQRGATVIEYVFVAMLVSIAATLALTNIGIKPANMLAPATSALEGSPP